MAFSCTQERFDTTTDSTQLLLYALKTKLLAAGWTLRGSADGTSFYNRPALPEPGEVAIDYWTTASAIAVGAWVRLYVLADFDAGHPAREVILRRTAARRVEIVFSGGPSYFTGAGASATARPTCTTVGDEITLTVGGTDIHPSTSLGQIATFIIGGAAENYAFFCGLRHAGIRGFSFVVAFDALSWHPDHLPDIDPAVYLFETQSTPVFGQITSTSSLHRVTFSATVSGNKGWHYPQNGGAGSILAWTLGGPGYSDGFIGTAQQFWDDARGPDVADGSFIAWPGLWSRPNGVFSGTSLQVKGQSRLFSLVSDRYQGSFADPFVRLTPTRSHLVVGCIAIPWDGSTDYT
jgi:hypothetical protein